MKSEKLNLTTGQVNRGRGINAWRMLARLKIFARNSWFLLGNVLLLIGGDDSVELCQASSLLQLPPHTSIILPTDISEDSSR